jgi:ribosome-binding protein aMBF1 (putative translation factor)
MQSKIIYQLLTMVNKWEIQIPLLAYKMQVKERTIQNWMKGTTLPSFDQAKKITQIYNGYKARFEVDQAKK